MSDVQNVNVAPVYADAIDFSFNMYTFTMDLKSIGINKVIQILGAVKLSPATAKLIHKQLGECIDQYEELYNLTIPVYTEEYRRREQEYDKKIKEHSGINKMDSPVYIEPVEVQEKESNNDKKEEKVVVLEKKE